MIINSSDYYSDYSFFALVGEGDEGKDGRKKRHYYYYYYYYCFG
jgi:hypothetical protein